MAVKVQQVLEILEQIAPPELACSWDNVGLLVDAGRPVTSIMTALDITADVVRDAAESGCESGPGISSPTATLHSTYVIIVWKLMACVLSASPEPCLLIRYTSVP